MIRLLLVDDHQPTRQQAAEQLSQGGLIKIVAEAETSDQAMKIGRELLPDIVLLDLHLPGLLQTHDLIKRLVALRNVKVIMFASQGKAADVQELLDAGASGYVLKTDPPALLRMAILMVQKGAKGVISPSLPRHITHLSAQERTALRCMTMRGTLAKAPERMGMSEEAFAKIVETLCEKLELDAPEKLVKWAKKHGF
ncbi:MAG TPA: response regulator [Candidatus Obscuribacterales bacterium]